MDDNENTCLFRLETLSVSVQKHTLTSDMASLQVYKLQGERSLLWTIMKTLSFRNTVY